MNRIDHAVIGGLLVLLGAIAVLIGAPALLPASPSATASTHRACRHQPVSRGRPGPADRREPVAARTQADRDLVALVFSGLVARGPDGMLIPDLASRWTADPTGKSWTFTLRPDATWHDGTPVTAQDVVYTVGVLNDPAYTGPGAGSWSEVTATAVDERTVRFDLGDAARWVPRAGDPADRSGPPARRRAGRRAGHRSVRAAPVGSGPYVLTELDDDHASLDRPRRSGSAPPSPSRSPRSPRSARNADADTAPVHAEPLMSRIEFRFFDMPARSRRRSEPASWTLRLASPRPPRRSTDADAPASRATRHDADDDPARPRPIHPELRDSGRPPRAAPGDRPPEDRRRAFGGRATVADSPDPADVVGVRLDADSARSLRTRGGRSGAHEGWLDKEGQRLGPPGATDAYTLEILSPTRDEPGAPRGRRAGGRGLGRHRSSTAGVDADPATPMAERLGKGEFGAAVVDISIGHDPDLYPLLASSQTRTGG